MNKVFWSETDLAIHEAALALLGRGGRALGDGRRAPVRGSTGSSSPWPARSTPGPGATWFGNGGVNP